MALGAPEVDVCDDCMHRDGLCARHERGVLPQLAQPFWYRLVGTPHQKSAEQEMSPEARRIANRKRTKAARREARAAKMAATRARDLAGIAA